MATEDTSTEVKPPEPSPKAAESPSSEKEKGVDKEKILSFLEDTIDTLTFKRVGLLFLATLIGLTLFSLFENRNNIVNYFTKAHIVATDDEGAITWTLSEANKSALINLTKTTAVTFVSISDVDLKKNRRLIRWFYINDPNLKPSPDALKAFALPQAVFDYDAKNTQQMVATLSNDFRCDPYKDTIFYRYGPELIDQLPTICRIAIPPFVGQFAGFLTIGIGKQVPQNELDSIRLEVSRLAVQIYLTDVNKKPTTAPVSP